MMSLMLFGGLTYDGKRGGGYLPFSWADIQPQFANNSIATNMITSLRMFWIFRFLLHFLSPVEGEKAFGLRHMFRDTVIFFVSLQDKNTRKSQSRLSSSARRMFSTDSSHIPRIFPAR